MDIYMGIILPFAYAWTPQYFHACNGAQLQINQYTALYSLLGTVFGGDAKTVFNLPNLQGRTIMNQGTGPGLTPRTFGQAVGGETATLVAANLPGHTHTAQFTGTASSGNLSGANASSTLNITVGTSTTGGNATPSGTTTFLQGMTGNVGGEDTSFTGPFTSTAPSSGPKLGGSVSTTISGGTVSVTPSGTVAVGTNNANPATPFNVVQPSLVLNFAIAVQGLYPTRS